MTFEWEHTMFDGDEIMRTYLGRKSDASETDISFIYVSPRDAPLSDERATIGKRWPMRLQKTAVIIHVLPLLATVLEFWMQKEKKRSGRVNKRSQWCGVHVSVLAHRRWCAYDVVYYCFEFCKCVNRGLRDAAFRQLSFWINWWQQFNEFFSNVRRLLIPMTFPLIADSQLNRYLAGISWEFFMTSYNSDVAFDKSRYSVRLSGRKRNTVRWSRHIVLIDTKEAKDNVAIAERNFSSSN